MYIHISQKSPIKLLNKSPSLQTLSLERVQLSDMVSPPRDVYNVASPTYISLHYTSACIGCGDCCWGYQQSYPASQEPLRCEIEGVL